MTGRDVLTAWQRTRSALATCLLMTLIVIGGAGRLATPAPALDQPAPKGALVDGYAASEHGVRPGQAGVRLVPDLRQPHPAVDGGVPAAVIASPRIATWVGGGRGIDWPLLVVSPPTTERFAHSPRGPPVPANVIDHAAHTAGMAPVVSWNRGPILRQGPHRT